MVPACRRPGPGRRPAAPVTRPRLTRPMGTARLRTGSAPVTRSRRDFDHHPRPTRGRPAAARPVPEPHLRRTLGGGHRRRRAGHGRRRLRGRGPLLRGRVRPRRRPPRAGRADADHLVRHRGHAGVDRGADAAPAPALPRLRPRLPAPARVSQGLPHPGRAVRRPDHPGRRHRARRRRVHGPRGRLRPTAVRSPTSASTSCGPRSPTSTPATAASTSPSMGSACSPGPARRSCPSGSAARPSPPCAVPRPAATAGCPRARPATSWPGPSST